ncbi:MAG: glycosyltransferase family 2 protein [Firmicutes bacterium]|nr:glycosyltransferase family 2 protein [Bacillota bacterium]
MKRITEAFGITQEEGFDFSSWLSGEIGYSDTLTEEALDNFPIISRSQSIVYKILAMAADKPVGSTLSEALMVRAERILRDHVLPLYSLAEELELPSYRRKSPGVSRVIRRPMVTRGDRKDFLVPVGEPADAVFGDRRRELDLHRITVYHERLEREVQFQRQETLKLQARLEETNCEIKRLAYANEALSTRLSALQASFSWRITQPLRVLRWYQLSLRKRKNESDFPGRTTYQEWIELYDTLSEDDREKIRVHILHLERKPLFSIVTPVYNTPPHVLEETILSVMTQLYSNWELCIADDGSSNPGTLEVLRRYEGQDDRIKIAYRGQTGGISEASNTALELATGEYLALLDHDDLLSEHALYLMAVEINRHPDAVVIYSDEDKIDVSGKRFDPYFKPDWSPDLILGQNYVNHLGVYRRTAVLEVGGFRKQFDGSQDWDLVLRISERLHENQIRHIPAILYHWRALPTSTASSPTVRTSAFESGKRAVEDHLNRTGIPATVFSLPGVPYLGVRRSLPEPVPLVSIIIPTKDHFDLLSTCLESIFRRTIYPRVEIIVVDNASQDPLTLQYLQGLTRRDGVRVIKYNHPYNWSAINNFAVRQARGSILVLLNNDTEVLSSEWLRELVSHAVRPEVGVVGAKLLYPDDTVQHGGVCLGAGAAPEYAVAGHLFHKLKKDEPGYFGRALLTHNVSAVTGACMAFRRDIFESVGGFDEEWLPVAFNDVDFCLKVRERGFLIVFTPFAELYHFESASRGRDDSPVKISRFHREVAVMLARWGSTLRNDPYYNPNLDLVRGDFSLGFPPRYEKPWV